MFNSIFYLKLLVHEGEQHDLRQLVYDFFEVYRMNMDQVSLVANEILKRLPAAVLQIPVNMSSRRQVSIRFSTTDNITNVVEGFVNFYELEDGYKTQILKIARSGMAPGSFMI